MINTLEDTLTEIFVRKLIEREKLNNRETQEISFVLKK
jgi:hypothetical protein